MLRFADMVYLDDWNNTSYDDKRQVTDSLITVIRATLFSKEGKMA